jgi:hypothetical protein
MTIVNSMLSANTANDAAGIRNVSGQFSMTHVTIANNTGVGLRNTQTPLVPTLIQNNLLANNSGGNCAGTFLLSTDPNQQENLDSDGTCGFPGVINLIGVDPKLGPLQNNGGPTQTHALLAGSPAIDSAFCPTSPPVTTDQRGVVRPIDGNRDGQILCDIGAFEFLAFTLPLPLPGVGALTPRDAAASVGQPVTQTVTWDVPGPLNWGSLTTIDYRLRDGGRVVFWLRWDQATNLFQLLDQNGNPAGPAFAGGIPFLLGDELVRLDLAGAEGRGSGPTGLRATLTLPLVIGEGLNGRVLTVELSGSSDFGATEPFRAVGTIAVGSTSEGGPNNGGHEDEGGRVHREKDDRRPPSEQQRLERDQTNRGGSDDYHTEGNVVETRCEADPPSATIANRDGLVRVVLLGDTRSQCGTLRAGQYLEVDGTKVDEGLFEAETIEVSRR